MNVSLPEELKRYVEQQTHIGYSTPSEYVRELIREDQKRRTREQVDLLLLQGLQSGPPIPVTPEFWSNLKKEALAKLNGRRAASKVRSRKQKT